ncbi:dienelactone hydrolase family protein [Pontibacter sp. BT310]|uniref:Dienelactone hydrolase family protein n=1 Tax=Pontibacter populi TaxID=890055 RepID=A0ABS6XC53_9BACT|nr:MULTISPECIES: alpha/beta fold hydrolase [Pontibacter]MBJ6118726.1 dienelactone hydrolase family protein [Pontibacter sp. BT310]MBR0571155.1 dienelactone hydrolase family protein [Microvirga sp. STS03]MBW3365580.1 dienelactone hydrolase family protein [Pontibacter populi]
MTEQQLLTQRTARYYSLGTPSDEVTDLWIVCHGYGQLARYFLRHFAPLDNGRTVIVAPEALSRFYLDGFSGRVGATWMTKEDRLSEIEDQVAYLSLLLQTQLNQLPENVRVTIVGFSQGGATVSRWLASGAAPVHRLVLWAASFPEDIDFTAGKAAFTNLPVAIVYGTQDKFITPESLRKKQQLMSEMGITPHIYTFEGGHTLDAGTLVKVDAQL